MPLTLTRPNYTRVMDEVSRLHAQFQVHAPPIDPRIIAQGLGVRVAYVNFDAPNQNISGFFDCESDAIYVNKEEYPLRQTFTIAHELGHRVLHAEWARSADYRVLLRDQDYNGTDVHEKEANAFAAHLLVPRMLLNQYWPALSEAQLSRLFAVSVPMIHNRLKFEYGV